MQINGIPAQSEGVINDRYMMIFPQDTFISPPFAVTTTDGDEVYTIDAYPVAISKEINMSTGETKIMYGRLDPVGERITQLEQMIAEIEVGDADTSELTIALEILAGGRDDELD